MTQVMMTQDAHRRVADRLAARHPHLDIVIQHPSGELAHADPRSGADIDPEIYWASLDAFEAGTLPAFFRQMLSGTRGRWLQTFNAGLDNSIFRIVEVSGSIPLRSTKAPLNFSIQPVG